MAVYFASAVAVAAVGALINWGVSLIPGNQGNQPGNNIAIQPVAVDGSHSQSHSSSESSSPAPPKPYAIGDCLGGNFRRSRPRNVSEVTCSSDAAKYQVLEVFGPESTDLEACQHVHGARKSIRDEYFLDGELSKSYVYCLG